jgi:hypothetical protein
LSDQSRRIAIKPSIRLATECMGCEAYMAGAEVPEGEVLLGNVSGVKKHCHKNVIRGLDFRAAGSLLVAASVYYGFEVGSTIRSVTEWSDIFSTDWCSAIWIASGCPDHNHGLDRAESPVNTRTSRYLSARCPTGLLPDRRRFGQIHVGECQHLERLPLRAVSTSELWRLPLT